MKLALLSTCISLSRNGDWDILSASESIGKVEEVLQVFSHQLKSEASCILPFIFEYEPSVWSLYTSEHHKAMNLSYNLENMIYSFHTLKNEDDKLMVMEMISENFNEFVLFNYNHMDDEEAVLNEILWRYYNDNFIGQIEYELKVLAGSIENYQKGLQIATAA